MKKLISLLLVTALILSLAIAVPAFAEDIVYSSGNTVKISLTMPDVEGLVTGIEGSMSFGDGLEYVENSFEAPHIDQMYCNVTDNSIIFNASKLEQYDLSDDKVVCSAKFSVTKDLSELPVTAVIDDAYRVEGSTFIDVSTACAYTAEIVQPEQPTDPTDATEQTDSTEPTDATEPGSETQPTEASENEDNGFAVSFVTDGNATVNIYYNQDYSAASETNVTSAVSRNKETSKPDSTGEGQVNFTVVLADGFEIDSVTAAGGYKNLKGYEDTGLANTYRLTKITAECVVTITTKSASTEATEPSSETQATEPTSETQATQATQPTEAETKETQPATKAPSLTYTKKSLQAASTFTVGVKNKGTSKVTYSTSNKKIATVTSKGVVTALQKGAATITVKVGSKKLTCKVTVTNNPVIKKGKKYLATSTYKVKKGKTLTFKLYRKVAGIKNVYTSTKKSVAKVTSKTTATKLVVKGYKVGTATITVKVNGVKSYKIKVKVVK